MDKILIIDDEKTVLETLTMALSEMSFEVISTDNAQAGKQLFSEQNPFLLIIDLNLGVSSGLDFIHYLIETEVPKHRLGTPTHSKLNEPNAGALTLKDADFFVLVLTGYGTREIMRQCAALGVEYCLNKPIHINALRGIIEKIYKLKQDRNELNKLSNH